jgi:hypothetical protein
MAECPLILTDSHIIVGNSSNQGADVAMTGSIQIDNTGATSINPSSTDDIPSSWTATTQPPGDDGLGVATTQYADTAASGAASVREEDNDVTTDGDSCRLIFGGLNANSLSPD